MFLKIYLFSLIHNVFKGLEKGSQEEEYLQEKEVYKFL